jgi:hypothetical protein
MGKGNRIRAFKKGGIAPKSSRNGCSQNLKLNMPA